MMLRYFISLFRIDIADSAQPKVLDGHQTLFLVRGCGLGTRLVLYVKLVMSVYYKLRVRIIIISAFLQSTTNLQKNLFMQMSDHPLI